MKISASKKTITILSICLVFLLLGGISFLYKDVISNGIKHDKWFVIDKYEELLEDCEWKREGNQVKSVCNALLHNATDVEKLTAYHCYNLVTIPKANEKMTYMVSICEDDHNVKWEGKEEWLEKRSGLIPVKYSIVYKRRKPFHYEYSSLELENATEKDLFETFYKNNDIKEYTGMIETEYHSPDFYENYVFLEKDTFEIEEIGHLYVLSAKLIKKDVVNEKILLSFSSRIKEEEIIFTGQTEGFLFFPERLEAPPVLITAENINEIEEDKAYQFKTLYLNNKSNNLVDNITQICNSKEVPPSISALCVNKETILSDDFKINTKDNIVQELLSSKESVMDNNIIYLIYSD